MEDILPVKTADHGKVFGSDRWYCPYCSSKVQRFVYGANDKCIVCGGAFTWPTTRLSFTEAWDEAHGDRK